MINIIKLISLNRLNKLWLLSILVFIFFIAYTPNFFIKIKFVDKILIGLGFQVKKIEIIGNKYVNDSEVLNKIKLINCENLFCLDLENSKKNIENISWIKIAKINLVLPSKLIINLEEEEPYFLLKNEDRLTLLNINGKKIDQIDNSENKFNNLLILKGAGAELEINNLLNIFAIDEKISKKITEAILVSKRRWSLIYGNDLIIDLPEKDPEEAFLKIGKLEQEYSFLSNKLRKIDLRINNRMIIKLNTKNDYAEDNNI